MKKGEERNKEYQCEEEEAEQKGFSKKYLRSHKWRSKILQIRKIEIKSEFEATSNQDEQLKKLC